MSYPVFNNHSHICRPSEIAIDKVKDILSDDSNMKVNEVPKYLQDLEDNYPHHEIAGGFLTGSAIARAVKCKVIQIEPYDKANINPNSYNLTIGNEILYCKCRKNFWVNGKPAIDLKDPIEYEKDIIPEDGIILYPGELYLIATKETIGSNYYIPMITGRSSMGRAGISVHQEAGFGDIGYHGKWTLQVTVTYPTKIYPNMKMAQMYMVVPSGPIDILYNGKYQGSKSAHGSEAYKDFE